MGWVEATCTMRCNISHSVCLFPPSMGLGVKESSMGCAVNGRCPDQCDAIGKTDIPAISDWNVNEKYTSVA